MNGRSEGDALTLEFLSQYSASVYVDLFHSLSLEEHTKDIKEKSTRTVPKVGQMITSWAPVQNLVMVIQNWKMAANERPEINEYTCFNLVRHRQPARFESQTVWRAHTVKCHGHEKGKRGRRK
jgi:hypothetical protein